MSNYENIENTLKAGSNPAARTIFSLLTPYDRLRLSRLGGVASKLVVRFLSNVPYENRVNVAASPGEVRTFVAGLLNEIEGHAGKCGREAGPHFP